MYGARLGVVVVLARLLPPSAFGVVAAASIVVSLTTELTRSGFSTGIIQRKDLTETHIRVAFTLAALQGACSTLVLWWLAPWIAGFFDMAEVEPILRLLALEPGLAGLSLVSSAILTRRLEFRDLVQIEVQSFLLGYAGVGVSLALLGYGAWALAWAAVAQTAVSSAAVYLKTRHPIRPSLAIGQAKGIFSFGVASIFARLGEYGAAQGDGLVVARFFGSEALGYYRRAFGIMTMPIGQFSGVMRPILFPVFSSIQDDAARLRQAYRGSVSLVAMGCFPALALIGIVAPELVRGVFGQAWEPAVPVLQVVILAGMARSVHTIGTSVARAKGATGSRVIRNFLHAIGVAVASFEASRWGIQGVGIGVTVASLIPYFLTAQLVCRLIGLTWGEFFRSQFPGWGLAGLVAIVGFPLASWLRVLAWADFAILITVTLVSGLTLAVVFLTLPRRAWGSDAQRAISLIENRWPVIWSERKRTSRD